MMVLEVLKTTPNLTHLIDILNNICDKNFRQYSQYTLRKKCRISELSWSLFPRIWTEYREIRSVSSYSVRMRENMDENYSEYRLFSRSDNWQ